MIDPAPLVVAYGRDRALLETRRLVLQKAGFQVWTVTSLADAEKLTINKPSVMLILCHSLSIETCEKALEMAHSRRPGMKSLVLMGAEPICELGQDDELMSSIDGPEALIATIKRMLHRAPPPSSDGI